MRILNHAYRLYVEPNKLEAVISFYEKFQSITCGPRFVVSQAGLEVAVVGRFILLSGEPAALEPVRHVQAVLTVDALDEVHAWLQNQGAQIITAPHRAGAGGRNLVAVNPDGLVAEYYEAPRSSGDAP
ncbi:VOC family protein [Burkholderia cenocepacia]|uniref:VOC family protein n=1 Tax=Burkholderia cenocepacia TaxID=95486 RepID=UPI00075AB2E5|nr:VOC family protein [Burkholderia cenocepacia]AOK37809.1 hypothetical protein WL90_26280 [Burkholderia cenocepacia]KWF51067.1 hypothetical protein WL89_26875 [Burkholderia cenocepacia]MDF0504657.1 VOC family protein [Burkholderia cenocepacia]